VKIGYETKEFHKWLNENFNWVDSDIKRYMFKAWRGRVKLFEKQEVEKNE